MNPFDSITRVLRTKGNSIHAYNARGEFVVELTEEGLVELMEVQPLEVVLNLKPEHKVQVCTTDPVYLTMNASPVQVDGVRLKKDDLILVLEQRDSAKNGIYTVYSTEEARGPTPGTWWVRAGVQPNDGDVIVVEAGRIGKGTRWVWVADKNTGNPSVMARFTNASTSERFGLLPDLVASAETATDIRVVSSVVYQMRDLSLFARGGRDAKILRDCLRRLSYLLESPTWEHICPNRLLSLQGRVARLLETVTTFPGGSLQHHPE